MPQIRKQSVKKKTPKKKTKKKGATKTSSVVDKSKPIGFDESEGIKMNLYGRSATGKTTVWSTFPKPILAIICSGSEKPGELRSIVTPENLKTIREWTIEKTSEIRDVVQLQEETGKYATIVLDHITSLQDYVLRELLDLDKLPEQLSWGMATQQQWGQVAVQMKELLRSLLNLSCNVVLVAQEREFNVDSDSDLVMPYVASAMTPSCVGWLNPAVDYIAQTRIRPKMVEKQITKGVKKWVATDEAEYTLRTGPSNVYTTKFRVPKGTKLPKEIIDPTYDKIMKIIKGG